MSGPHRRFRGKERQRIQAGCDGRPPGRKRDPARMGRRYRSGTTWARNRTTPVETRRSGNPQRRIRTGSRCPQTAMMDLLSTQASHHPLTGWRILTTRASKQSGGLARPLRELGAEVIEIPTIEIKPPASYKPLDSALKRIADYDWLILTSINGAEAVFARLKKLKLRVSDLAHLKIAAIGPATKKAIEAEGLKVTVTPDKYIAESVVEALRGKTEGKRVLLARAKIARDVLPNELKKAGVKLEVVEAYETRVPATAK